MNTLHNIFQIPVAECNVDKSIIDEVLKDSEAFISKHNWNQKDSLGRTITSYYVDSSDRNFLGEIGAYSLLDFLNYEIRNFLQIIGYDETINIKIESWLNLNLKNTTHNQHEHFGAIASGVVYLKAGKNSGNIVFPDPIRERVITNNYNWRSVTNETAYNKQLYVFTPTSGKCLLFESWLPHFVNANENTEPRISVSFNAFNAED